MKFPDHYMPVYYGHMPTILGHTCLCAIESPFDRWSSPSHTDHPTAPTLLPWFGPDCHTFPPGQKPPPPDECILVLLILLHSRLVSNHYLSRIQRKWQLWHSGKIGPNIRFVQPLRLLPSGKSYPPLGINMYFRVQRPHSTFSAIWINWQFDVHCFPQHYELNSLASIYKEYRWWSHSVVSNMPQWPVKDHVEFGILGPQCSIQLNGNILLLV